MDTKENTMDKSNELKIGDRVAFHLPVEIPTDEGTLLAFDGGEIQTIHTADADVYFHEYGVSLSFPLATLVTAKRMAVHLERFTRV